MDISLYKSIIKPILFLTPPETAHGIAKWFLKRSLLWRAFEWRLRVEDERLETSVGQLRLRNPVGLAAGFDKNCEMSPALLAMGFGYLTLGTVTLNPREGNPKPRIWRYPDRSLVNSMGLPNEGAEKIAGRLARTPPGLAPRIVSISGLSLEEFVECYRLIAQVADGVELNISTPNTVGVRIFQEPPTLERLLDEIIKCRISGKPVWVKLPPYFNEKERENVLQLAEISMNRSIDALTLINTKRVEEPRASIGTGGLSGPPIYEDMIRIVSEIYAYTGGKIPINACGGIDSGPSAWHAFEVGASSVQLYTALIYEGPAVASKINRDLLRMLRTSKFTSLGEVVGSGLR